MNGDGATAMHLLAKIGALEPLSALMCSGANVNAVDSVGETLLYYGLMCADFAKLLQLFVDNGGDVNVTNSSNVN